MRVYVCYFNHGYEGKSEPMKAFTNAKEAEAWRDGVKDSSGFGEPCVVIFDIEPTESKDGTGK